MCVKWMHGAGQVDNFCCLIIGSKRLTWHCLPHSRNTESIESCSNQQWLVCVCVYVFVRVRQCSPSLDSERLPAAKQGTQMQKISSIFVLLSQSHVELSGTFQMDFSPLRPWSDGKKSYADPGRGGSLWASTISPDIPVVHSTTHTQMQFPCGTRGTCKSICVWHWWLLLLFLCAAYKRITHMPHSL